MRRFDRGAALWAAAGMLLLVELLGLFAGIKECGPGGGTIAFLSLALITYVKFPWLLLVFALISASIGLLWRKQSLYRTLIIVMFVTALIAVPVVTYIVVPSAGVPCEAI
jgi:hypothetical protein